LVSKGLGLFAGTTNCLKDWHGIVMAVFKCPAHPIIKVCILSTDVFVCVFLTDEQTEKQFAVSE
jgi:hypothetical protein